MYLPLLYHTGCACVHAQSCLTLQTPWTLACQAPLSIGFSRKEYWSGLPFPNPEDLPDPGIKPASLTSPILAGNFYHCAIWEALWDNTFEYVKPPSWWYLVAAALADSHTCLPFVFLFPSIALMLLCTHFRINHF